MTKEELKIAKIHEKAALKEARIHAKAIKKQDKKEKKLQQPGYAQKEELKQQKKAQKQAKKEAKKAQEEILLTPYPNDSEHYTKWDKLDNTAHLFPVIAGEDMTNVYRMCIVLKEEIEPLYLEKALHKLLPWFQNFHSVLRQGFFWYYFEENPKRYPPIREESEYPCQYFAPNSNRDYLFRLTYYKCRINLEVFHVLTDGSGCLNFLRELTYQYLNFAHPDLVFRHGQGLSSETSLNTEDSYEKNYRHYNLKGYANETAYLIKGPLMKGTKMGVLRGMMDINEFKKVAKHYGCTINELVVATFFYSVYHEYMHALPSRHPITAGVPVDLRPYFNSETTKNFFVMISAKFKPTEDREYSYEEIIEATKESLRSQLNKDHLEEIFSFAVGNEKIMILRTIPLVFKNMGIRAAYKAAARKNSTTITNVGSLKVKEDYRQYIDDYYCFLSRSYGQDIKACISSFQDRLSVCFSSKLTDVAIQRGFFRKLAEEGLEITIESNGVYYG